MCQYLFVYGTLRPADVPDEVSHAASQLRLVGEASVPAELYDLGHFPGAILSNDRAQKVSGLLFELPDDSTLRLLDEYEEFFPDAPGTCQFNRVRCEAETASGCKVPCWIYVYVRDLTGVRRIESGVWSGPPR